MYKYFLGLIVALSLFSCKEGKSEKGEVREDLKAKELLQGVWLDEDTEMPLMEFKGDSIYYSDPTNMPVAFHIVKDTIYIYGKDTAEYQIDRQTADSFWFHSLSDEVVKLHKSDNPDDEMAFGDRQVEAIQQLDKVMQKDSVVMFNNRRFRGYVYINPSTMKVYKTSYSENGYLVENVYYDNVIHICVYEGKKQLYGKDFVKNDFEKIFPQEFLQQAILSDMEFLGVNKSGYHYRAQLRLPETSILGIADITISPDNKLTVRRAEN